MITLADYIGHCDQNGCPIGHPIKVLNETAELLHGMTEVKIAVPRGHIEKINYDQKKEVICFNKGVQAFSKNKIGNFLIKWKNLKKLDIENQELVWFVNVDFSLFLFLFFHKRFLKKSVISLCYNPVKRENGWRKYVTNYTLKNARALMITNKNFKNILSGNTIFIPDYYYNSKLYDRYRSYFKYNRMVCLGTMGETKKLEELVLTMNNSNYQVLIKGNFSQSMQRYENLRMMSESNILIENEYVSDNDYYECIASSRYVVLPYDMNLYDERTSGILLESIFLGSIPIAPKQLLEYNSIYGIGYTQMEDIVNQLDNENEDKIIRENNNQLIEKQFSIKSIQKKIKEELIDK